MINLNSVSIEDGCPFCAGYFVSSDVPENFAPLSVERAVFLAYWTEEMDPEFNIPTFQDINMFYQPGHTPLILHYSRYNDGKTIAYA